MSPTENPKWPWALWEGVIGPKNGLIFRHRRTAPHSARRAAVGAVPPPDGWTGRRPGESGERKRLQFCPKGLGLKTTEHGPCGFHIREDQGRANGESGNRRTGRNGEIGEPAKRGIGESANRGIGEPAKRESRTGERGIGESANGESANRRNGAETANDGIRRPEPQTQEPARQNISTKRWNSEAKHRIN